MMKVDGAKISEKILDELKDKVAELKKQKIVPTLAILLLGHNPASVSYVRQKELKSEKVGIRTLIFKFFEEVTKEEIEKVVKDLNKNSDVHGIIIQRPLPFQIDEEFARNIISKDKDVDGFLPQSKFDEPIAEAVLEILKVIFSEIQIKKAEEGGPTCENVFEWLKTKQIVIVGKGDTGGRPIIKLFKKMGIEPNIIDSKTRDPGKMVQSADILISTVGRPVIRSNEVKKGSIVIGIGMHKKGDGKLHPDYDQDKISRITSYYTPVPGGVGPVNVAMLLKNLISAVKK